VSPRLACRKTATFCAGGVRKKRLMCAFVKKRARIQAAAARDGLRLGVDSLWHVGTASLAQSRNYASLCRIWEYLGHDSVVRGARVTGVPSETQELEAGSAMRTMPCERYHANIIESPAISAQARCSSPFTPQTQCSRPLGAKDTLRCPSRPSKVSSPARTSSWNHRDKMTTFSSSALLGQTGGDAA
jgi:hypothetical protein